MAQRIRFKVNGQSHDIDLGNFTAIDAKDFRKAVGISLGEVFAKEAVDIDVIAGILWLDQRRFKHGLTYDVVARGFTYDTELDVEEADAKSADAETNNPET